LHRHLDNQDSCFLALINATLHDFGTVPFLLKDRGAVPKTNDALGTQSRVVIHIIVTQSPPFILKSVPYDLQPVELGLENQVYSINPQPW
jgi:hypothetical protein